MALIKVSVEKLYDMAERVFKDELLEEADKQLMCGYLLSVIGHVMEASVEYVYLESKYAKYL